MLAVPHWQGDLCSSSWAILPRMSMRFQMLYLSFASAPSSVSWNLFAGCKIFLFTDWMLHIKKFVQFPWYPVFLSLYPALNLLGHNISQVGIAAGWRPLLVSGLAAILMTLLFRLIYQDWHRAAVVAAAWVLLFFSYSQVFDAINDKWKPTNLATGCLGSGWGCLSLWQYWVDCGVSTLARLSYR